jgi:Flp pilus assembly protein TadB
LLTDERKGEETMVGILWAVVAILVVLWLIGFVVLHVSSALIHLLLIIAVIVLLYNLFVGGRSRRTL